MGKVSASACVKNVESCIATACLNNKDEEE